MNDETYDNLGRAAMQAWSRLKKAQTRSWGEWMIIGEGLQAGREWAMHVAGKNEPSGKGYSTAFSEWLTRYRLNDMDKSDRAKLLQLMDERPAVEEWRAGLDPHKRRELNNPVLIWRRWTNDMRGKKPKRRPTPEAQARAEIEELQARVEELEQELADARAEIKRLKSELDGTGEH